MTDTDINERCETQVSIGSVEVRCERPLRHRGTHQADVKAEAVYDDVAVDTTATVEW